MRPDGTFRILGRKDNVVCSGGIKLQIEEIEAKLANIIHVDFAISSKPDEKLGEKLVLVIEDSKERHVATSSSALLSSYLGFDLTSCLEKYEIPKEVFYILHLPRTESGKIARATLKQMLSENK